MPLPTLNRQCSSCRCGMPSFRSSRVKPRIQVRAPPMSERLSDQTFLVNADRPDRLAIAQIASQTARPRRYWRRQHTRCNRLYLDNIARTLPCNLISSCHFAVLILLTKLARERLSPYRHKTPESCHQDSGVLCLTRSPDGIRTRATALRGRRAGPLHNGAALATTSIASQFDVAEATILSPNG